MTLALIGNVYGSKLRVASLSTCSCFVKFASSSEFWILSNGLFCCWLLSKREGNRGQFTALLLAV